MSATPEGNDGPRRNSVSPALQELVHVDEYEQHLIKLWREVGSVSQGGMGVAPLVWSEVIAWANQFYSQDVVQMYQGMPLHIKRCVLEDYEIEIVMQLSREYCDEYNAASDPKRECPKEIFLDEVDAVAESDAFFNSIKQMWGIGEDHTKPEIVRN